jgi:uncharacterized sulfatase
MPLTTRGPTPRRAFALLVVTWLLTGILAAGQQAAADTPLPPNIILIMADDLGYGDIGCYGQQRIRTPNIDRLASEGIRFTQYYAGSTVCAPSRCALMTGRHVGHCRVRGNAGLRNPRAQALREDDVTLAEVLKPAGYATGLIGKWGLGDDGPAATGLPRRQGFDEFFGYLNQSHAHNYYPTFLWRNETKLPLKNIVPDEGPAGTGVSSNKVEYSADLIAAEALSFVRNHRKKPFLLCWTPTIPHANNQAGKQGMEVPDYGEYAGLDWPEPQKGHAAMITRLDSDIGRLMALLRELQLDRRTLVLFTSDNGPHREGGNIPAFNNSSGGLRGIKRAMYEGGIRVPMVARWPGHIPAGTVSDQVWAAWDLLPTFAELAGTTAPADVDGLSFVPTLRGKPQPRVHEFLYWEFYEKGFKQAVRWQNWKGVSPGKGKPIELYDLKEDPGEQTNVAASHPELVQKARKLMTEAHVENADWPVR